MSYSSQRALTSTAVGVVVMIFYTISALRRGLVLSDDWRAVAIAMLIFMATVVVLGVLVQIVFHLWLAARTAARTGADGRRVKRMMDSTMAEGEMERLITLKAGRATSVGAGAGMVGMLVLLACGVVPGLALHVMLWTVALAAVVEGGMTVYFAETGVSHG